MESQVDIENQLSISTFNFGDREVIQVEKKDSEIKHTLVFIHGMDESGEYYLKKIKNGILPVLDGVRILLPVATL